MRKKMGKEKYTREMVNGWLDDWMKEARENDLILYIKALLSDVEITYKYFKFMIHERFGDDDEIQRKYQKIKEIIGSRVVNFALAGKVNAAFAKFYLINIFKDEFKSQSHLDITTNGKTVRVNEDKVDRDLEKILKAQNKDSD